MRKKLPCPKCGGDTIILCKTVECDHLQRRRKCTACNFRFNTIEIDKDMFERLVKKDDGT